MRHDDMHCIVQDGVAEYLPRVERPLVYKTLGHNVLVDDMARIVKGHHHQVLLPFPLHPREVVHDGAGIGNRYRIGSR